jgi:AraC family transcriptional regulator
MNASETNLELTKATLRPRFESHGPLLMAGLQAYYTFERLDDIPKQWERFVPQVADVGGRVGEADYGLCINMSAGGEGFDYVTGVQVADLANLPAGWIGVRIPAQTYAIFSHPGHVSTLRHTAGAIGEEWLPTSGREPAQPSRGEPNLIERYGPKFDPTTGTGDIELWFPIKA